MTLSETAMSLFDTMNRTGQRLFLYAVLVLIAGLSVALAAVILA